MSKPTVKKGKTGWDVYLRHNGQRHRKSGFSTYKAANEYAESVVADKIDVAHPQLELAIRDYLSWSENVKRKSPRTMRSDKQRLGVLLQWANLQDVKYTHEMTVEAIRTFQKYYFDNAPFTGKPNHRTSKANPSATWEKYRQNLSAFCNWCVRLEYMKSNPLARAEEFKVQTHHKRPSTFKASELKDLFEYFDTLGSVHLSAFYRLLAYTGCRLNEAVELKWENVDFENEEVVYEKTKNYETRAVPIVAKLRPYLEALPNGTAYVFDSGHNSPIYHDNYYWRLLQRATSVLQIKARPIHAFRHTFCSHLAEADVNLATIKELAGHKNINTTLKYLQFTKQKKRNALTLLPY